MANLRFWLIFASVVLVGFCFIVYRRPTNPDLVAWWNLQQKSLTNWNVSQKLAQAQKTFSTLSEIAMEQPEPASILNVKVANTTKAVESLGKKFLSIGIATVYRKEQYLKETLQSLVDQSWPEERNLATIVIFLADTDEGQRTLQRMLVEDNFRPYLESGFIQLIEAPPSIYPSFDFVLRKRTYDDSIERVIWRTKQVIDFAFLLTHVAVNDLSEFHIVLEDDLLAANQYITAIRDFVQLKRQDGSKWSALQFTTFLGIGLLLKTSELEKLANLLILFDEEMPVDGLMNEFTSLENPGLKDNGIIHRKPSIFQHIGKKSTLANKVQNLLDKTFGKGNRKLQNLKNPPACRISSTLTTVEDFVPENAYSAAPGWFQGTSKTNSKGNFNIVYATSIDVDRIAVISGSATGAKRIGDGAQLFVGSHSESQCDLEKFECKNLNFAGMFQKGDIDIKFNETTKVQCIQIQLPAQAATVITEIKVFQKI